MMWRSEKDSLEVENIVIKVIIIYDMLVYDGIAQLHLKWNLTDETK